MADGEGIGIPGIAGIASTIGNIFHQGRMARMNRKMFEHQKFMDMNGVQVRARDLEAAGLSKTLAAGNAATTNVQANSANVANYGEAVRAGLEAQAMTEQIAKTRAEVGLTEELRDKAREDTRLTKTNNATAQYDLQLKKTLEHFNISQAQSQTAILKTKEEREIAQHLNDKLKNVMDTYRIVGQRRDNIIKNATLELMKLEKINKKWYHDAGLPYDIGWDAATRGLNIFAAGLKNMIEKGKGGATFVDERAPSKFRQDLSR